MSSLNSDIIVQILSMTDRLTQSRAATVSKWFNDPATLALYRHIELPSINEWRPKFSPAGLIQTLVNDPKLAKVVNIVKIHVPTFQVTVQQIKLLLQSLPNITSFELISSSIWPGDLGDWFIPAISRHSMISRLSLDYDSKEDESTLLSLLAFSPKTLRHMELRCQYRFPSSPWAPAAGWGHAQQALPVSTNFAPSLVAGSDVRVCLAFQHLQSLRARWTVAEKIITGCWSSLVRLDVEFDQGGSSWPPVSLPDLHFLRVRYRQCMDRATERAMFDGIVKSAPNLKVLIVRIEHQGNWPNLDKLPRLGVFAIENHWDEKCQWESTDNASDYIWEYSHKVFPVLPQENPPPISVIYKRKMATYKVGIDTPTYIFIENGDISWDHFDV